MTRDEPIKIAIVGTGLIGPRHAQSVVAWKDADLLCLIDPAPQAEDVARSFKVPLFNSITSMLEGGCKPDAAIVCTPNSTHVKISKDLLAVGVHVLVEKPISTTLSSGEDLIRAAQLNDKKLLVGHHRRFNPYITAAKNALTEGVIGRPIAVSGLWLLNKPNSYFAAPTEWRASSEGGGVVLINLIHEVDILMYLLGPIIRVHAEQTASQRGNDAEEGAAILLRFASGVVGTFLLSDATPSVHNFESATGENPIIPQAGKDVYRIFGTDGTLSVGDMKVTKHAATVEKSWSNELEEKVLSVGDEVPFDQQLRHFVRVVKGVEAPRCSGEDGLRALLVCDSVKRALREGCAVDVPAS